MGKSISTISNTKTTTIATKQATFAIGDLVLCPSLSDTFFVLTADPCGQRNLLALTHDGSYFYYDEQGFFVKALDDETGNHQPNLYRNTPANQQAINTLYGNTTQSSQRTVIDTTEADDKEAVLLSAFDLRDIACDIEGAITTLNGIGLLLHMIYQENITYKQALSMARLTHDSTDRWADLLCCRLNTINAVLAKRAFGTEVAA